MPTRPNSAASRCFFKIWEGDELLFGSPPHHTLSCGIFGSAHSTALRNEHGIASSKRNKK